MPWTSSVGRAHSRSNSGISGSPTSSRAPISFSRVLGLVERQPRPRFALLRARRHHAIVESRNADVPVAVLERAQNFGDGLHRIGRRAAVDARVQVVIRALHVQFAVHDAAQSDADGGQLGREHLGVADHGGVGLEPRAASATYASMCSPPVSSSPSIRNFTFTGSRPFVFSRPSTALIRM